MPRGSRGAVGDPRLTRDIKGIIHYLDEQSKHVNVFDVKNLLVRRHAAYRRKPDKVLLQHVKEAVSQWQAKTSELTDADLMHAVDIEDVPTPDPGERHVSMSLLNQKMNTRLALSASASAETDCEPPRSNDDANTSSTKGNKNLVQNSEPKRKRIKTVKKKQVKKGMYMGKVDANIEDQIIDGLSNGAGNYLCKIPSIRFKDVAGINDILDQVRQFIGYPLLHPEAFETLGVKSSHGMLLHGPPGCGKTLLANAIAGEMGVLRPGLQFFKVSAPELVAGKSGESETNIRALFSSAANNDDCSSGAPSLIFIDEIDAIAGKRENFRRAMEHRIVAQLLTSMDEVTDENKNIFVIAATGRPESLDKSLRRAGRFDCEIMLSVPDEKARAQILQVLTAETKLQPGGIDYKILARLTPGFVGADLSSVVKEAGVVAIHRLFHEIYPNETASTVEGESVSVNNDESRSKNIVLLPAAPLSQDQMHNFFIKIDDLREAISRVQPTAKREGFATVPGVSWKDVGALQEVREELELSIVKPIRYPEYFERVGLHMPSGILLYGPPGCGKTLLAKAIANESGANFISVKGPELLDKFVGESERAVRVVFQRAQKSAPCIIFFDELDALAPRRGSTGGESGVSERVVNQLLTELDGLETRRSVYVIGATNRPDILDRAMLRPGRLDKKLYVPLPSQSDRLAILNTHCRKLPMAPEVKLDQISSDPRCENFSGADCYALVREASLNAIRFDMLKLVRGEGSVELSNKVDEGGKGLPQTTITMSNFLSALDHVKPSVPPEDVKMYESLRDSLY